MANYQNCIGCGSNNVVIKNEKPVCGYCGTDAKEEELTQIVGNNNLVIDGSDKESPTLVKGDNNTVIKGKNLGSVINISHIHIANFS